jgi:hypothetical protein
MNPNALWAQVPSLHAQFQSFQTSQLMRDRLMHPHLEKFKRRSI